MHRKLKRGSNIAILMLAGVIIFFSGFNGTIQESRMTQKVLVASSSTIFRYKVEANSNWTRAMANKHRPLEMKLGWILYTFDQQLFLRFMQFLLDKVIIFKLMICQ